jgi:hydrogenase nickel incorporation protein HypB
LKTIPVVENVLKLNDEVALLNRDRFRQAGVFVVNLIGAPGSGKTTLLGATLARLHNQLNAGVIVGDPATSRDGQRLGQYCDQVVQVNTGHGCHLDANQVRQALAQLNLDELELLIIENVGNLICPVGFDLGQHTKVGLFSVSEGDDKAAKHPHLVLTADLLLLNKMDLLPHVEFNIERFCEDISHLRSDVELLKHSVKNGDIDPWINWLINRMQEAALHES